MFRTRLVLTIAMILIAASASARLPRDKDRWIEMASDNFTFFSNTGERATRRIAADLEEFRAVLAGISDLEQNSPLPIYVYIFKNDASFTPYKMLYQGRPSASAGYFLQRDQANYIAINAGDPTDASGIVYHEFVHYYCSTNLPHLPLWFEEGLAEVYQTFEVSRGTARIGVPIAPHIYRLRTSPSIPVDELFTVDHSSPLYNETDRKGTFYSQSWALVHYLLISSPELRRETQHFVALLQDGVAQDEAFAQAYSADPLELSNDLKRYLDRTIYPVLELPATTPTTNRMTVRTMSRSEVLYRLGDLLMQQDPPRDEVLPHLQAAVDSDPHNGQALAALAFFAEQRARWDEAGALYERALRAAPHDAMVQYRGGVYMLRRGGEVERAREALRESTRLQPDYAPAWVALSGSYMAAGEYSAEALAAAETAHWLLPSRTDVSATLLRQYLENDQRHAALELASRAFGSDPTDRRMAYAVIARSDLERARQLVAEGRPERAMIALDQADQAAVNALDREMLARHIAKVRSNIIEQSVSARYNEAVAAYNGGDVDHARSILEDLSDDELPGRHAEAVRSFIDFIDDPDSEAQFPPAEPLPTEASPGEIDRLNQLIATDRLDEAVALLHDLNQRVGGQDRDWIDAKIEEIERAIAQNRFAASYNRAVNLFNGGAYAAAIVTLEDLLETDLDALQTEAARALLADAESALVR